jgi:hypothetical protein
LQIEEQRRLVHQHRLQPGVMTGVNQPGPAGIQRFISMKAVAKQTRQAKGQRQ